MTKDNNLFHHIYIDNEREKTLFLLHGTGGNEKDLLPLVTPLADKFNFLGIRGNVDEGGMTRFFKRKAHGIFDRESIDDESKKLTKFIQNFAKDTNSTTDNFAYLGYSNGANMILAILFTYPNLVKKAALLHPMLPYSPSTPFKNASILVTYGEKDPMVTLEESEELIKTLKSKHLNVTTFSHSGGHEITEEEVKNVINFLSK